MTAEPPRETQQAVAKAVPAVEQAQQLSVPLPQHVVKRTRIGGIWVAAALFALVLLLLLIFILQNGQRVSVGYFGAHGHLPLGVALLLAAVLGVLLVVIPGSARIVQLRLTALRHRLRDTQAAARSTLANGPGSTTSS
jgi:uncharacterized integral membrane protein